MSFQNNEIPSIPSETLRAARAVFSRKNFYILVGEQLEFLVGDILQESLSETLTISRSGWVTLPLITFFQFIEGLTDEQAGDAVRTRIDWKYALHLPVNTFPFHRDSLCEFRQKVLHDRVCQFEFQKLVDRLAAFNPPYHQTVHRNEVLVLVSSVCSNNISNRVLEAMRAALGALASYHPEWLRQVAQPHWYWRFNQLSPSASQASSMRQYEPSVEKLGADIQHLLEEVDRSNSTEIRELIEIKTLQHIWQRYFELERVGAPAHRDLPIWINCDSCRADT